MQITTASSRGRARARWLSYRGHALVSAVSIAVIMAAILVMSMKAPALDGAVRAPLKLNEPGPPPITVLPPGQVAPPPPRVRMAPIACPDAWKRPNVTCWQAQ